MIDKILVEKKLRKIEEFLRELEMVDINNIEAFKEDVVSKRFIERDIELAIEQMIDICRHFVSRLNLSEPETYAECFDILVNKAVIPGDHLETYKAMARFRNFLIHAYDDVDDSITYGIFKKHLDDFRMFISEIRNYLIGRGGESC